MSEQFLARESNGRHFVINAGGVLVWNVNRESAVEKLLATGIPGEQVDSILSQSADGQVWYATLLSGLTHSISRIEESVSDFQERWETDKLAAELDKLRQEFRPLLVEWQNESWKIEHQQLTVAIEAFNEKHAEKIAVRKQMVGGRPLKPLDLPDEPEWQEHFRKIKRKTVIERKLKGEK